MLKKLFLGVVVSLLFVGSANAWYLDLEYNQKAQNLFVYVTWYGDGESIDFMSVAAESTATWDTSKTGVEPITVGYDTAWREAFPPNYDGDKAIIYGETPLTDPRTVFYPDDGTILGQFVFSGGDVTDDIYFCSYLHGTEEQTILLVDRKTFWLGDGDIEIVNDGQRIGPYAVPIPGAIWLLGSGLLCLFGIRRKVK